MRVMSGILMSVLCVRRVEREDGGRPILKDVA